MQFSNVKTLLEIAKAENLAVSLATSVCLMTIAQTNNLKEAELMMDFVGTLKVKTKQLFILTQTPQLKNSEALQNKTMNFDVTFIQEDTGIENVMMYYEICFY